MFRFCSLQRHLTTKRWHTWEDRKWGQGVQSGGSCKGEMAKARCWDPHELKVSWVLAPLSLCEGQVRRHWHGVRNCSRPCPAILWPEWNLHSFSRAGWCYMPQALLVSTVFVPVIPLEDSAERWSKLRRKGSFGQRLLCVGPSDHIREC